MDADIILGALFDQLPDQAFIVTDASGNIERWSEGARHLLGWTADEAIGQPVATFLGDAMAPAPESGSLPGGKLPTLVLRSKSGKSVQATLRTHPLRSADGARSGFLNIVHDRSAAQADGEFVRSLLAASDECIKMLDLDANLTFMSEGGQRIMEVSDYNRIHGCSWSGFWEGEARTQVLSALSTARAGRTGRFQAPAKTVAGTPKWWDVQVSPIFGLNGQPERFLSISRDISDLKRAEGHQRLLAQELAHRVKNMLSIVQALAVQTFRASSSLDEARQIFTARIQAMARANDLALSDGTRAASLHELLSVLADSYAGTDKGRFAYAGPDMTLKPDAAAPFALLLHEMATNATKYGALSTEHGQVQVTWAVDNEGASPASFTLVWREEGGPPITTPQRRSFGSRLIEDILPVMLGAHVQRDYLGSGVRLELRAPKSAVIV